MRYVVILFVIMLALAYLGKWLEPEPEPEADATQYCWPSEEDCSSFGGKPFCWPNNAYDPDQGCSFGEPLVRR